MALNLNRVLLAGNLTRDPEIKFLPNEKCVAQFGLAINRRFKDASGEQKEEVTFVDVEAWGRTAELVGQYLTKGRGCFVEGRLKLEQWDDKESGQKRSKLKVVADQVLFTDAAKTGATSAAEEDVTRPAPKRPAPGGTPHNGGDDEPPFAREDMIGA
jgi:single-strand DNA-binding protein